MFPAQTPPRRPVLAKFTERQMFAVTALVTCAAFVAVTVSLRANPHAGGPRLALTLLAFGPVLALRRWPLPFHLLAAAATTIGMATAAVSLPFGIMLGITTFLAASQMPRRLSIRVVVGTVAVLCGALVYAAITIAHPPLLAAAGQGLVPLVAAWFIGDGIAARRRYLAVLAQQAEWERAERARQEVREERVRIARELHDVVAHSLTVITVQAGVGRRLMAKWPEEAGDALASIESIGRTAQDELRVVLGLLRDEQGEAASLTPAPRLTDLKELTETVRDSGNPVDLHFSGTDRAISPSLELSLYRVVQEALTNVVKHAPGARAVVDLTVSDTEVSLEVSNEPGAPGVASSVASGPGSGHGIIGMRERVGAFGGQLSAGPRPEGGFRVEARIPLEEVA
ncbi:MAG TPA: sensor histidine kinase [Streptosporangiaceae bacterium]|nr:sensor histidine kinase [Streptosporangiaceae bacterium]